MVRRPLDSRRGPRDKVELPSGFLTRIRNAADVTQAEISSEIDASISTIGRAEQAARWLASCHVVLAESRKLSGSAIPNLQHAQKICQGYGLDFDEIKRSTKTFIQRMELFEQGQIVPPMPDKGEE